VDPEGLRRFAAATVSTSCQVDDVVVADAPTTRRWPHRKLSKLLECVVVKHFTDYRYLWTVHWSFVAATVWLHSRSLYRDCHTVCAIWQLLTAVILRPLSLLIVTSTTASCASPEAVIRGDWCCTKLVGHSMSTVHWRNPTSHARVESAVVLCSKPDPFHILHSWSDFHSQTAYYPPYDTRLYGSCMPSSVTDFLCTCIDDMESRMRVNWLQLNTSKTDLLWCSTTQGQHQLQCSELRSFTQRPECVTSASISTLTLPCGHTFNEL